MKKNAIHRVMCVMGMCTGKQADTLRTWVPRCAGTIRSPLIRGTVLTVFVCCFALSPVDSAESDATSSDLASSDASEVRGDIVRSIEFEGNTHFKDKVLRQRIGVELGDQLDPFLAEGARRVLIDVYKKVGYVFVEVGLDAAQAARGRLTFLIAEGARVRVQEIRFVGNRVFSKAVLREVIKSKTKKLFVLPSYYTAMAAEDDSEKLREFYYDHGYLGYDVTVKTEFSEDKAYAVIIFIIEEGQPYRIESIAFAGNTHFSEEVLAGHVALVPGDIYRREVAEKGRRDVEDLYQEQGFVDVTVGQMPTLHADPNTHTVTLTLTIKEGKQFRIGRIQITGNEGVQDRVVRRVLGEYDFTPGKVYNAKFAPPQGDSMLEKYVQRATLAEEVIIQPVVPEDGAPDRKDVHVNVTEGMTGMIMPGVGVSSDHGFMGQLVYQQRNFDYRDTPDNLWDFLTMKAFRGAGQTMRIALEPGQYFSRYSATFSEPYFMDRPIDFDLSGMSYERWLENYQQKRERGSIGFEHRKWGKWRKIFNMRVENVGVRRLEDAPQAIRDVKGDNFVAGFKFGTGMTEVDDIYMPHKGYVFRVAYEQVTGDFNFGIWTASGARYFTIYEDVLERKTVLAAKVQGGHIVGDAPPFEKFYAGGMDQFSIRGFDYRGVSTRGQEIMDNPAQQAFAKWQPIGSDSILTTTAEITVPLIGENFSLLTFADGGLVDTGCFRFSVGAGVQILVPQFLGPVPMRFEYGVPIKTDDHDETRYFNFTMGRMF